MTTPTARALVIARLGAAPNLTSLAKVWASISPHYQRDPEILAVKDQLKAQMEG